MKFTDERYVPGLRGLNELEHLNRYYFVVSQFDLQDKIVLDIACGEGYGTQILSGEAYCTCGVDISEEAVVHAQQKYGSSSVTFTVGDASMIPYPDSYFDLAVSFETIEHHDRHEEMMRELKRVLKPDGILVISSPDKYYFSEVTGVVNSYHVKELYYDEFKKLISSHFTFVHYFMQRTFNGSLIVPDSEGVDYTRPLVVQSDGRSEYLPPLYNMAVAANEKKPALKHHSVYYTLTNDAVSVELIEKKIKKSESWKVGHFIVYPFALIKRYVKRKKSSL